MFLHLSVLRSSRMTSFLNFLRAEPYLYMLPWNARSTLCRSVGFAYTRINLFCRLARSRMEWPYLCPECNKGFKKWSMCRLHLESSECFFKIASASEEELMATCRAPPPERVQDAARHGEVYLKPAGADRYSSARSGKLERARSRLYQSQILQVNMRWEALAEIYKMHSFARFS